MGQQVYSRMGLLLMFRLPKSGLYSIFYLICKRYEIEEPIRLLIRLVKAKAGMFTCEA